MRNGITGPASRASAVGGERADELFEVLSHPHRRFLVQHLRAVDDEVPVAELTDELASAAGPPAIDGPTGHPEGVVETSLVHRHLPKMDDTGFVDYDRSDRTVAPGPRTEEAHSQLIALSDD